MTLRVLDILFETMMDGPGLRTSIYFAGCKHRCKGCHNPQSWDMNGGYSMPINHILTLIKEDEFANVTFSGGDPFYQVDAVTELAKRIKAETNKTIWCYTGFTIEEIRENPSLNKLLPYIDVLVDGPYVEALRNTDLPFRGSENQRIIYINNEKSN
jgi:anaerobic ribonucleoside-triphosphate reductase activating protein